MSTVRVLVADDHAPFRAIMRAVLAAMAEVEVVGEADSADAAVAAVRAHVPDVVLMDLRMPGGGLAATARIREAAPQVAVLVISMHEDEHLLGAALAAGARGYLLKDTRRDELRRAVHAVHAGQTVLGPALGRRIGTLLAGRAEPFPELTTREREILGLLARGLDNAAIAGHLFLSVKTVQNVVSALLHKIGAGTRAEAVALARDAGVSAPRLQ